MSSWSLQTEPDGGEPIPFIPVIDDNNMDFVDATSTTPTTLTEDSSSYSNSHDDNNDPPREPKHISHPATTLPATTSSTVEDTTTTSAVSTHYSTTCLPTHNSSSSSLTLEYRKLRQLRRGGTRPTRGTLSILYCLAEIRRDVRFVRKGGRHEHVLDATARRCRPLWGTYGLMLLCTAGFMYTATRGMEGNWQQMLLWGWDGPALIPVGALSTPHLLIQKEWWRCAVAPFLHNGLLLHLVVNVGLVYTVGGAVEGAMGGGMTVVFYGTAVASMLCSALYAPFAVSVGASGGICGWLGFGWCMAWLDREWLREEYRAMLLEAMEQDEERLEGNNNDNSDSMKKLKLLLQMIGLPVLELVVVFALGLLPWLDNFTHIAGFVYGFLLGLCCIPTLYLDPPRRWFVYCYRHAKRAMLGFALLLGLVATTVLYLARSETIADLPCRQCDRHWNCVLDGSPWCDPCRMASAMVDEGTVELFCPYGEMIRFDLTAEDSENHDVDMMEACAEYCVK